MFLSRTVAGFVMLFFAVVALAQEPSRQQVSQPTTTQPASTNGDNPYERKKELVEELEEHADWYDYYSWLYGALFVGLTLAILIGSVVTSLLVALEFANRGAAAKALVVGLPLLTGLFTTILSQFHVQDMWKLREIGRIDAMILSKKVKALQTASNDVEMRTKLLPYEVEKYELERRQALAFFEYLATQEGAGKRAGGEAPVKD